MAKTSKTPTEEGTQETPPEQGQLFEQEATTQDPNHGRVRPLKDAEVNELPPSNTPTVTTLPDGTVRKDY